MKFQMCGHRTPADMFLLILRLLQFSTHSHLGSSSPKGLVSATRMTRTLPCHGGAMLCAICDSSGSLNKASDLDLWWSSVSRVHPFRLVSWLVIQNARNHTKHLVVAWFLACLDAPPKRHRLLVYSTSHSASTKHIPSFACIYFKHTWPWESVLSKAGAHAFYKSSQFIGYHWNIISIETQ